MWVYLGVDFWQSQQAKETIITNSSSIEICCMIQKCFDFVLVLFFLLDDLLEIKFGVFFGGV